MTDRLWKVTVSSLFPNDNKVESVYEGHHADEAAACDAALTKEAIRNGGSTIDRVVGVEEIG
ncbi:hypothetical protein EV283_0001 [Sphingomonas sp. BK036]|uniref:hypothetical protein n=1 Tax=Sphingomonas sp. BK036 TaxID=2512122 RepID=UPI00102A2497|nr:hypothetical protein [Sphingomonas sp. BK036]RZT58234.1 hypothetical protein EV283_0001 [Sphingomonas sp. BK036]